MQYNIENADESHSAEWDGFVTQQNGWTHFHLYGWRRVIKEVFGHSSDYLVARAADGRVAGVLPLVRVRSALFGDFMVSMPYLNYGGPLGSGETCAALAEAALLLAQERGSDLLELRCRAELGLPMDVSTRKITVVLDLPPGDADALFKGFDSKLRSQIRRPIKEGVVVEFGGDRLDDFFAVFSEHMRDLGTPTLPKRFFARALAEFGERMWIGVAYKDGAPVACGCGFEWGDELEITWAASLRSYNKIAPNMLLYWSFIQRAVERGMRIFNFGRCTPGGGTHKFKKQWNTRDEQLWWYQRSRAGDRTIPSPDGKFSFGPRVWRHLPLPVATALGPRIVRFIP